MIPVRDQRGFTLIETLVALSIVILVVAALYRGLADGGWVARAADAEASALIVARSRLAALAHEIPLAAGHHEGVVDGIRWRLDVREYQPADGPQLLPETRAYWATVTVTWRAFPFARPGSLRLTTLKLASTP